MPVMDCVSVFLILFKPLRKILHVVGFVSSICKLLHKVVSGESARSYERCLSSSSKTNASVEVEVFCCTHEDLSPAAKAAFSHTGNLSVVHNVTPLLTDASIFVVSFLLHVLS